MNSKNGREEIQQTAEQAAEVAADTAERVRDIAADAAGAVSDYARQAGSAAQEVGRQAGAAAQAAYNQAYNQGGEAVGLVEDIVRQNPWGAMLVAACLGYGVACLVKNTR
jgi:ElaB/YqjD/DUF883 family membrane-anchored ribosome-binding protein